MASISDFSLSWWYTPDTKLSLTFLTLGATLNTPPTPGATLNYNNGLSASLDENYHFENVITNNPVEKGLSVSDYIIRQPKTYTITGLLSAIYVIPIVGTGFLNFNQLGSAVKFLSDAADSGKTFALTTGLYFGSTFFRVTNVAIQSLDIPRNNQYGKTSVKFTMVLKEIVITSTDPSSQGNSSSQGTLDPTAKGVS
jgi:hypothetical protein